MDLLAQLTQAAGAGPSRVSSDEVRDTPEFRRIRDLPVRDWTTDPDLDELVERLSLALLVDPTSKARLWPHQAQALRELYDLRGLVGPIPVGGGKTLISLLAGTLMGAKRPVLLLPANLRDKTLAEAQIYAKTWRVATNLTLISYQLLSNPARAGLLERLMPDLIVADEIHACRNNKTAAAKRLNRYLNRYGEHCPYLPMSGTAWDRRPGDFGTTMRHAIKTLAPVPGNYHEAREWDLALGEKVPDGQRLRPGPLVNLTPDATGETDLDRARVAYSQRLARTPGIVIVPNFRPKCSLNIRVQVQTLPESMAPHFDRLRTSWETPDGHPFETALARWRHEQELACGFYQVWDPRPPRDWLEARKAWSLYVREILSHSRTYDSPGTVALAIQRGDLDDKGIRARWKQVEPSFVPVSVPYWVDDTYLTRAADWLERHPNGLVWTEHRAFAHRLAELTGIPYFGSQGKSAAGVQIEKHKGSAILSRAANSVGRNLQHQWAENLIVAPQGKGSRVEQLLARTHREGQTQAQVEVEIWIGCRGQFESFAQSRLDADNLAKSTGQDQKLAYATVIGCPTASQVADWGRNNPIW